MSYLKLTRSIFCWSVTLLFIFLIWLGHYMVGLTYFNPWYHDSLMIHRSLGLILLLLTLAGVARAIRQLYILKNRRIKLRVAKRYQRLSFYLLLSVISISGLLVSTSAGRPVSIFRLFFVPAIATVKKQRLETIIWLHYYLAYGLALLAITHALTHLWPKIKVRWSA